MPDKANIIEAVLKTGQACYDYGENKPVIFSAALKLKLTAALSMIWEGKNSTVERSFICCIFL